MWASSNQITFVVFIVVFSIHLPNCKAVAEATQRIIYHKIAACLFNVLHTNVFPCKFSSIAVKKNNQDRRYKTICNNHLTLFRLTKLLFKKNSMKKISWWIRTREHLIQRHEPYHCATRTSEDQAALLLSWCLIWRNSNTTSLLMSCVTLFLWLWTLHMPHFSNNSHDTWHRLSIFFILEKKGFTFGSDWCVVKVNTVTRFFPFKR